MGWLQTVSIYYIAMRDLLICRRWVLQSSSKLKLFRMAHFRDKDLSIGLPIYMVRFELIFRSRVRYHGRTDKWDSERSEMFFPYVELLALYFVVYIMGESLYVYSLPVSLHNFSLFIVLFAPALTSYICRPITVLSLGFWLLLWRRFRRDISHGSNGNW